MNKIRKAKLEAMVSELQGLRAKVVKALKPTRKRKPTLRKPVNGWYNGM